MSEQNQSSSQTDQASQTQEFKQAARDEALSAAEKGLEAAREALAAAEEKLAEAQRNCESVEQQAGQQNAASTVVAGMQDEVVQAAPSARQSQEQCYQPQGVPTSASPANPVGNTGAVGVNDFATGSANATAGTNSVGVDNTVANSNAAGAQNQGYWQGQTAQGGYQPQPVQPPYTTVSPSSKDHVAAGLLAIFLGTFGIHKFYLGYNTQGFIMLAVSILAGMLTFGIAAGVIWVIAVIEGVLYLTKNQSDFDRIYVYNKREWF